MPLTLNFSTLTDDALVKKDGEILGFIPIKKEVVKKYYSPRYFENDDTEYIEYKSSVINVRSLDNSRNDKHSPDNLSERESVTKNNVLYYDDDLDSDDEAKQPTIDYAYVSIETDDSFERENKKQGSKKSSPRLDLEKSNEKNIKDGENFSLTYKQKLSKQATIEDETIGNNQEKKNASILSVDDKDQNVEDDIVASTDNKENITEVIADDANPINDYMELKEFTMVEEDTMEVIVNDKKITSDNLESMEEAMDIKGDKTEVNENPRVQNDIPLIKEGTNLMITTFREDDDEDENDGDQATEKEDNAKESDKNALKIEDELERKDTIMKLADDLEISYGPTPAPPSRGSVDYLADELGIDL